ncbi:hypothetical protein EIN_296320 [Entamoeba invadens IP1]|uniref:PiggyBac transposable element-derived protein domain-containing protein n=1 Tax=Entamoeba invadens IP1 TaxID=370355 RepID=L7FL51_ENTIV|nr:hypothetical protein EIN_296320 [Entamoeba invadens IP1]ELP86332.1 hypothetical protein EIN_296320 [Entamoeba invadens IP1]|eukprot:XP_004185678.1 hypothetical protein EIN_296320 [Entamoeba invadens IP1]
MSHYLAAFGCLLLGTMRMNRKEVPAEAKDVKKRSSDTTIFFSKGKSKLVSYYNEKKNGVDTADQMVRYYSCRRKTYRWNIRVLYDMIDIAALNGYKTYSAFNKGDRINIRISFQGN